MSLKLILLMLVYSCFLTVSSNPVLKENAVPQAWKNKQADIYFLLDTSASVWIRDYYKMTDFVASLVEDMDIGPDKTRVGVGVYEENFHQHLPLDNNRAKESLIGQIKESPYIVGNGYISVGIEGVRKTGLASSVARPDVPHIAVVFTDGVSRYKQLALDNATLAKNDGIFLFMIGVGNGVVRDELYTMSSDPKSVYFYHVRSFDDLNSIRDQLSANMAEVKYFQGDEGSCGDKKMVDTVFVYDDYGLGRSQSLRMTELMTKAAGHFSMGTGNVRIAAISQSCRSRDIMLGQYVRREKLVQRLSLHAREHSPLPSLVIRARTEAFQIRNGARQGSLRRIVLVLDRKFTLGNGMDLYFTVDRAKRDNIEIFVIQLGSDYDKTYAQKMLASKPEWAFFYSDMSEMVDRRSQFFSKFCDDVGGACICKHPTYDLESEPQALVQAPPPAPSWYKHSKSNVEDETPNGHSASQSLSSLTTSRLLMSSCLVIIFTHFWSSEDHT